MVCKGFLAFLVLREVSAGDSSVLFFMSETLSVLGSLVHGKSLPWDGAPFHGSVGVDEWVGMLLMIGGGEGRGGGVSENLFNLSVPYKVCSLDELRLRGFCTSPWSYCCPLWVLGIPVKFLPTFYCASLVLLFPSSCSFHAVLICVSRSLPWCVFV